MTLDGEDKLCFLVCWNDKQSGLQRDFHLYFYPASSSVEMFDIKTRKVFLKKTETDKVSRGKLNKDLNPYLSKNIPKKSFPSTASSFPL